MDGAAPLEWRNANAQIMALEYRRASMVVAGEDIEGFKFDRQIAVISEQLTEPSALDRIAMIYDLSEAERTLILLAGLSDQAPAVAAKLADHSGARGGRATLAVADAVWGGVDPTIIGPASVLISQGLIEVGDGRLYERALVQSDTVRMALAGTPQVSAEVAAWAMPAPMGVVSDRDHAVGVARAFVAARDAGTPSAFYHGDAAVLLPVICEVSHALGHGVLFLDGALMQFSLDELAGAACRITRDAMLCGRVLVLSDGPMIWALSKRLGVPHFVMTTAPEDMDHAVALVAPTDAVGAWETRVPDGLPNRDAQIAAVRGSYQLTPAQVERSVRAVGYGLAPDLWHAAQAQVSDTMGPLAERVEARARWDDLILPVAQKQALSQMTTFLTHRGQVIDDWGFGASSTRGLGMAAVFFGPSGTGKTTAAEAIVREMAPDGGGPVPLYRVNVAGLVSKYIGETAKNFARVFEAGRRSGAALLFDEAEGLFGKRTTQVKDSNDKHSNAELGFLLQCLEAYPGIAILTTNMRGSIDDAFLRRFRFAIEFPFPDRAIRREIWQRVIPESAPVADLDFDALAVPALSGGNIRSVAINAAYLAAASDGVVSMAHLAHAVRLEFGKLEKPVPERDLARWVV